MPVWHALADNPKLQLVSGILLFVNVLSYIFNWCMAGSMMAAATLGDRRNG
jgi:hypothetical protein